MSDFSEMFFAKVWEKERILRSLVYGNHSQKLALKVISLHAVSNTSVIVFLFSAVASSSVRSVLCSNLQSIVLTIFKNLDSDALFGVRRLQRQPILALRLQRFTTSLARLLLTPCSPVGDNTRVEVDTRILFAVLLITGAPFSWAKSVLWLPGFRSISCWIMCITEMKL